MSIQMLGIDHNAANLDIRGKFSFTKKKTTEAFELLRKDRSIKGIVIISTCNRMEIYANVEDEAEAKLFEKLCKFAGVNSKEYKKYFVKRKGKAAVEHLFRLAAGLESMILGEDQILTQISEALLFSRENYVTDNVIETLFRQALTVGKKIKTEVRLSATDQSVVHAAIERLEEEGANFDGKKCMVIGNGVMGKMAATLLKERGAEVTVTIRQYIRGIVEVAKGCNRIDYGRRMEIFGDCQYVFSATVSPNFTLTKELIEGHVKHRMTLVDLAVPRDIEPEVAEVPLVKLYDIDDFRQEGRSNLQREQISQAEKYVFEQMEGFTAWYEVKDIIPKIERLKAEIAEDLVLRLTPKFKGYDLSKEAKNQIWKDIHQSAEKSMNKLLFTLRDGMEDNSFRESIQCLEERYLKDDQNER